MLTRAEKESLEDPRPSLGSSVSVKRRSVPPWLLCLAPALSVLLLFFIVPLVLSFLTSFQHSAGPATIDWGNLTLDNYGKFFANEYYRGVLWNTVWLGFVTTAICLVIGYPIAYRIYLAKPRWQGILLMSFLSPLLVSIVVRTYGWTVILSPVGLVNDLLLATGMTDEPLSLMRNGVGTVIGLTHVYLAFMILPIYSGLSVADRSLPLAARNLGASSWQAFRHITFRLTVPSVLTGIALVFMLSVASYVTPVLLGGTRTPVLAQIAYEQTVVYLDYPFGAAVGFVLLGMAILVLIGVRAFLGRDVSSADSENVR